MPAPDPVLRISDDLSFPLEAVTETFLIFAKRGVGKTYTASVLAEEFIGAGLPVCIVDPLGVWWGLRSSADGQGPGLPVTILGGEHADLPLAPGSGHAVADLLVAERIPVILDLSEMSKTQQRRFMTDFLERLYHQNREPLHVIIDEADLFAPQRTTGEIARLVGAYNDIARRGRAKGIGCTSITQRPAVLNADIRSQSEVLFAMRLTGKLDIAAIDDWIRAHADEDDARDLKASLPKLPVGTAWVWSPGWLDLLVKVKIRQRRTFDSSATPKVGERRVVPRDFARVDPADLERMAALLGPAAPADEPPAGPGGRDAGQLRTQVADLGRQLAEVRADLAAARARPAEQVPVPVLSDDAAALLREGLDTLGQVARLVSDALAAVRVPAQPTTVPRSSVRPAPAVPAAAAAPAGDGDADEPKLGRAERALLAVLAQFPAGRTRTQLSLLSGYSAKSSSFSNALGALRSTGLAHRGDPIRITAEGLDAAGDVDPLPSGEALAEHWMWTLSRAERTILSCLLDAWPAPLSRSDLAERSGYSPTSSSFSNALGRLRTLELVGRDTGVAITAEFAKEVGRG